MDALTALKTILDQVDYTAGNCRVNEMVGAVLPREIIALARQAIVDEMCERGQMSGDARLLAIETIQRMARG